MASIGEINDATRSFATHVGLEGVPDTVPPFWSKLVFAMSKTDGLDVDSAKPHILSWNRAVVTCASIETEEYPGQPVMSAHESVCLSVLFRLQSIGLLHLSAFHFYERPEAHNRRILSPEERNDMKRYGEIRLGSSHAATILARLYCNEGAMRANVDDDKEKLASLLSHDVANSLPVIANKIATFLSSREKIRVSRSDWIEILGLCLSGDSTLQRYKDGCDLDAVPLGKLAMTIVQSVTAPTASTMATPPGHDPSVGADMDASKQSSQCVGPSLSSLCNRFVNLHTTELQRHHRFKELLESRNDSRYSIAIAASCGLCCPRSLLSSIAGTITKVFGDTAPVLIRTFAPKARWPSRLLWLSGSIVSIRQVPVAADGMGTGSTVWVAAQLLAYELEALAGLHGANGSVFPSATATTTTTSTSSEQVFADKPVDWRGMRVVELGAGCGVATMALTIMGAYVVATDLDVIDSQGRALLDITRDNVKQAQRESRHGGRCIVERLAWGDDIDERRVVSLVGNGLNDVASTALSTMDSTNNAQPDNGDSPVQWVVASDILYDRTSYPLLLQTLKVLCTPATTVLFVNKTRYQGGETTEFEHQPFLQMARDAGFRVQSGLVTLSETPQLRDSLILGEADDVHGRADAPLLMCCMRLC